MLVRLLVVDDHLAVLSALQDWLSTVPWVLLAGTCCSIKETLACLPECRPDVVLLDVNMPEIGGLEAVAPIKRWNPSVLVIIMSFDEARLEVALRMPLVDGALYKQELRAQFLPLVQQLVRGETFV
jgi:DNA-binding NarL/FixJ family response regulator